MTGAVSSPSRAAASLARGVSATWWYTASSVVFIQATTLVMWALPGVLVPPGGGRTSFVVWYAVGGALSLASGVLLLSDYRRERQLERDAESGPRIGAVFVTGAAMAAGSALVLGLVTGSILYAAGLVAFTLCLLRWPAGVRLRLVVLLSVGLVALWFVDGARFQPVEGVALPHPFFAVLLPVATVLSLWWWDIVVELDRARATEGRLAAAQERLRLASDLHDLQGHHLQVIALQLELAERMMARDPDAAGEQVRLARRSVDDARAGTRELATRFRGVPLPDEIANAADLLRAAGLRVQLDVVPSADLAPADVLGPVIRECTTNVLKHGGGEWARISLLRDADGWRLDVSNDPADSDSRLGVGAGLQGIADRVGAVGGRIRWERAAEKFEVVVTVPVPVREVA